MSETKFTPGPWRLDVIEQGMRTELIVFHEVDGIGLELATVQPHSSTLDDNGVMRIDPEYVANAHLIAAAPNMHEALHALYRAYISLFETGRDRIVSLGGDCDAVDVMVSGDPALAKAREALALAEPA